MTLAAGLAAVLATFSPGTAGAGRIERLLWNAIRFQHQAERVGEEWKAAEISISAFDIRYDFQRFPRGRTFGFSAGLHLDVTEKDFFYCELPFIVANWDQGRSLSGFGDMLLEYQRVLYVEDPEAEESSGLLFAFDLIAPTGSKRRAIGEGAWVAAPGIAGIFQPTAQLTIAPSLAYAHSFGPVRDRSSVPGAAAGRVVSGPARQLLASINLIHDVGDRAWFLLSPDLSYDLLGHRTSLSLRAGIGVDIADGSGVSVQISRHVSGPEYATTSFSLLFTHGF